MGALARDSIKVPQPLTWLLRSRGGITGHGQVSWAPLGKREVHEETNRTFWLEDLRGAGMGGTRVTRGVSSSEESFANPVPPSSESLFLRSELHGGSYQAALSSTYFYLSFRIGFEVFEEKGFV